jgi:phospholipid/cholesterol/gamma-HCH transport system substrate-binding protein
MEERDKKTELLVGLFLTIGLMLIALLVLQFGSVRELFKTSYEITVPFPDGTGIRDGTPVRLGGSKVGKVPRQPVLDADFKGVLITLEIYDHVKIPKDAMFGIGTAGLLGDSFIEIRTTGSEAQTFFEAGTQIPKANVVGATGLGALQDSAKDLGKQAEEVLGEIKLAVKDLRVSLDKINAKALGDENMKELKESFAHLNSVLKRLDEKTLGEETSKDVKEAVASFKAAAKSVEEAAKKFDPIVTKLGNASGKIESAAGKADTVMGNADKAIKSIDEAAVSLGKVGTDLRKGEGLLPALIHDRTLKNEFSMLISNLRQKGILWYKDKAGSEQPSRTPQTATPAPQKQQQPQPQKPEKRSGLFGR